MGLLTFEEFPASRFAVNRFNLRHEPDVYVNGDPICARPPNKIGEYAELGNVKRDIAKANEVEFLNQCEMRKN